MSKLDAFFKFKENNTDVKTEIIAGITIFLAMAYILIVNPAMLSETGMDIQGVFIATALSAAIATILMGYIANYLYALAAGMGLNAFFTYTVVLTMGYSWEYALLAIFVSGIIFLVISLTSLREKLFYSIPDSLRFGISIGIGLFILALGLSNLGILSYSSQAINIGDANWATQLIGLGSASTIFTLGNLLALICFVIIMVLMKKNVKGNILIGIIATYIIGVVLELAGCPVLPDQSLIPTAIINSNLGGSLGNVAFKFGEASGVFTGVRAFIDFIIIAVTFLVISLFDTMGTLTALTTKVDGYDENGKLPRLKKVLSVDALGPIIGSVLGTSPVVTYIESSTGIMEGGRTGLTAIVVGILFLLAIPFAPIFTIIPTFAVAPALVVVGILMCGLYKNLDTGNLSDLIPALAAIIVTPLTQSITTGIIAGVFAFVIVKVLFGKAKEISKAMWILFALLFIYMVLEFIM